MDHKNFKIRKENIKTLVENLGACMATEKITVDGELIGYMYREQPDLEVDNGWRFLSGTETQEYADDSIHWAFYDSNTIANYDPAIIPYLSLPMGTELERVKGTEEFRIICD